MRLNSLLLSDHASSIVMHPTRVKGRWSTSGYAGKIGIATRLFTTNNKHQTTTNIQHPQLDMNRSELCPAVSLTSPSWVDRAIAVCDKGVVVDVGVIRDELQAMLLPGNEKATMDDIRKATQERWPLAPAGLAMGVLCTCNVMVQFGEDGGKGFDVLAELRSHGIALSDGDYALLNTAYLSHKVEDYGRIVDALCWRSLKVA